MKKIIIGVASVLGVLALVVIISVFLLGPSGALSTVGQTFCTRLDDTFSRVGLETNLAGLYGDAFSDGYDDAGFDLDL